MNARSSLERGERAMKRIPQEEWENMTREEREAWKARKELKTQVIVFCVLYPIFFVLLKHLM